MKINNLNSLTKVFLMAAALFALPTSCSKHLDINDDPNNFAEVPSSAIFTSSQVALAYNTGGSVQRIAAGVMQHYSGHRGQPLNYDQYNFNPSDFDNIWSIYYADVLADLQVVITKETTAGNRRIVGAAKLLQAYTYSIMTDLFGSIPMSEALKGSENLAPKYDTQEQVYDACIALIDAGIQDLATTTGNAILGDIIYAGSTTRWTKFGNSLKLRLLNHLEKRRPGAAKQFLDSNPSLITSNADDAKLAFGSIASNANPIYQFDVLSGRKDEAVSETIVDIMKASNDPRLTLFFAGIKNGANKGSIVGKEPGLDDDDSGETLYSRVGSAYGSINSPVMLLTYAEVQFIIAEVQKRAGSDALAKTAYDNAITADMTRLGVSTAAVTTYLTANAYNNTLERVMTQKWIAMFHSSWESWADWRRTGFPALQAASTNFNGDVIPRKMPLPQLEVNLNKTNVEAGPGLPVLPATLKEKVWWDL